MKQFFLITTGALVASVALTSCQQEKESCTKIANELTELLKQVKDFDTAEAAAPRAGALWTRLMDALARPVAVSGSSLHASSLDGGEALTKALEDLAEQVARVYASYPAVNDNAIDNDSLLRVVGTKGKITIKEARKEKDDGKAYLDAVEESAEFEAHASDKMPVVAECYGSTELKAALDLSKWKDAKPVASMFKVKEQTVVTTPPFNAPSEEEAKPEGQGDDSAENSQAESADEESTDEPSSDEEPADEEPSDEEPAEEEPADEEPADEEPADEEDGALDVDTSDLDIGDLDI